MLVLAFIFRRVGDKLKKLSLSGGNPITLCDAPVQEGGSWGPDDKIIFAADPNLLQNRGTSGTGLYQVSASGGVPESILIPDPAKNEREYQHPEILPGGKGVLFDIYRTNYLTAVLSLETGEYKTLVAGARNPHYAPTGHLIYELEGTGTLMAVPFDPDGLEITGSAVPILEGVRTVEGEGEADYAFSSSGSLVYVVGIGGSNTVVWIDQEGNKEPLLDTPGNYRLPRLSPNGSRLAVANAADGGDIWIYDLDRGVFSRLTFHPGLDYEPLWTPDGQRIVFASDRAGSRNLFWKAADGSGEAEQLTDSAYTSVPYSMSPDGKVLAYFEAAGETGRDIWLLRMDGDSTPEPFLNTVFSEIEPVFSPDGQWIAYTSNESGQHEIYVQPFPGPGGKWQISTEGGVSARWAPNGHDLFYLNGNYVMAVRVSIGDSFKSETPRVLFTHVQATGIPPNFSVSPDGKRFVMVQPSEQDTATQIHVVLNWFEELKRLAPTDN